MVVVVVSSPRLRSKKQSVQQHLKVSSSSSSSYSSSSVCCRCKKGTLLVVFLLGGLAWFLALINIQLLGSDDENNNNINNSYNNKQESPLQSASSYLNRIMSKTPPSRTISSTQHVLHRYHQHGAGANSTAVGADTDAAAGVCDGYKGIYHIQSGDIGGAAGTIFFQFVVGQIIWAEMYGFKPWVHLNNVSYIVYDNHVHGREEDSVEFDMMTGVSISYIRRPNGVFKDAYPGPPIFPNTNDRASSNNNTTTTSSHHHHPKSLRSHHFRFRGNGVWNSYFEPVSDFVPTSHTTTTTTTTRSMDRSCIHKPLVTMDLYLITPGVHGFAPWSPKCWRYDYMPDYMTLPHLPYQEWLQPQRQRAHTIMTKYIRFLPYLHQMADQVNPIHNNSSAEKCCGVHIRHSDKVGGRRQVPMEEFLPYLQAYVDAGGTCIYLATDSSKVLEVATSSSSQWPLSVRSKLRSLGPNVIRSRNATAVFDMTPNDHHRTNTEILVEILALSRCHFMIHGFSAVSETAIWIHYPTLHEQGVNLEDADHMNVTEFQQMVQVVLQTRGDQVAAATTTTTTTTTATTTSSRSKTDHWWKQSIPSTTTMSITNRKTSCPTTTSSSIQQQQQQQQQQYKGILHIAHAGDKAATGTAFFTTILNQLWYADQHQLLPWIHLRGTTSKLIHDAETHRANETLVFKIRRGNITTTAKTTIPADDANGLVAMLSSCPGEPVVSDDSQLSLIDIQGDGIWNHYFHPVSDFVPQPQEEHDEDASCYYSHLPLYRLKSRFVVPGLYEQCPGAIRAWRYDQVPASLWYNNPPTFNNNNNNNNQTLQEWMYPMRRQAHELVQKYYKFQPHIISRAKQVNPLTWNHDDGGGGGNNKNNGACLAVHIRQSDKEGLYRRKFPPQRFRDYMKAYIKAGGKVIYIASDSHRALEYIANHFPPDVLQTIRTQGKYVVRSTKKWPVFTLADHHRTNSEALVDILAMSYCHLLLHGYSAMSEAAIYLNLNLHNHSVNLEDPKHMSAAEFEQLARSVMGTSSSSESDRGGDEESQETGMKRIADNMGDQSDVSERQVRIRPVAAVAIDGDQSSTMGVAQQDAANTTIMFHPGRICRENAIVYLAQKRHSSYNRDSYGLLLQSLDLLMTNYLANHSDNADLFIFHTGDFDAQDFQKLISRYPDSSFLMNLLRLVDLSVSQYWRLPRWHVHDDPNKWYAYHLFKEGYRHMMHWFAIGIWDFFTNYNLDTGCNYGMIMRLDEDSFVHSPIQYNVFDFMRNHGYVYGYRLCAYELQVTQRMWKVYKTNRRLVGPVRDVHLEMCGFYNNFFVASLDFFRSQAVQSFLKLADRKGYIYRRRLGDLMIHSMVVYAFAQPDQIHRFLDFTYEHTTVNQTTGCAVWGGIQAGYRDGQANLTLRAFYRDRVLNRGCAANVTTMTANDLSPTYHHLPDSVRDNLSLTSIMAGNVELPHKGILSG